MSDNFSNVKADLFNGSLVPDEKPTGLTITINPQDNLVVTGIKVVDGIVVAVYAKAHNDLDNSEFKVFGSVMGAGLAGYGYGYTVEGVDTLGYYDVLGVYGN